jgi:tetratricopeptide (TPR) repeat protein
VEAGALNLLGRSDEALQAAEGALALDDASTDGWLERGVALFERLRFDDARPCLERVRTERDDEPRAAWYLGLLEEQRGDESRARRLFGEATRLDPEAYPPALALSESAFDKLLHEEARRLDEAERAALETTELGWTDLPDEADLLAGDPVLSPTIVGLFRPGEEGRRDGIVLYRRNLLRISRTIEELRREVRDTLRHELGHLRGEDDAELRDRGL